MPKVRGKNCWSSVLEGITGTWDLMHSGSQTLAELAWKIFSSNRKGCREAGGCKTSF